MIWLSIFLVAVLLSAIDREGTRQIVAACERYLEAPWLPWGLGVLTAMLVWFLWGSLDAPGAIHDERAYLVQARLFARWRWTAPSPPLPLAWEMPHVFLEPAIFSKYPPGHSLLLTPGLWIGLPGFMPVCFAGVTAGLLFAIVRRLASPGVAWIAWLLWTTAPSTLNWFTTYMSQSTTAALWMVALTALWHWWVRPRPSVLILLTLAIAWVGITRPMSGVVLALPVGLLIGSRLLRTRTWSGVGPALLVGFAVCAIIPLWIWRSTGTLQEIPYISYSYEYFPFDLPGFDLDSSPPRRTLPADMQALGQRVRLIYDGHEPSAMWRNFQQRSWSIMRASLPPLALPLLLVAPIGLLALRQSVGPFLLMVFIGHVGGYLVMPHVPLWTIYYLEVFPITPTLVAVGLAAVTRWIGQKPQLIRWRSVINLRTSHLTLALTLGLTFVTLSGLSSHRAMLALPRARPWQLDHLINALPDPRAVIFVRWDPRSSPHFTLIDIRGVPSETPTWVVRDLGDSTNAALLRQAGDRVPYRLIEVESMRLAPYQ